jgi:hypothetical protein
MIDVLPAQACRQREFCILEFLPMRLIWQLLQLRGFPARSWWLS